MRFLVGIIFLVLVGLTSHADGDNTQRSDTDVFCSAAQSIQSDYRSALATAGINESDPRKLITSIDRCLKDDSQLDPEDDGYSCDKAESNCAALAGARAKDLKDDYKDERDRADKADEDLKTARKDANDQAKEEADFEKDAADEGNKIMQEMKDEEADFNKQVTEQKKQFLSNITGINDQIRKIQADNRKIIQDAKKAMFDAETEKKKAVMACRDSARKAYADRLAHLDADKKAHGDKLGSLRTLQDYESYRKFLVDKMNNPQPSEFYSLCLSTGDQISTSLEITKMGTALNMDTFASQMQQNQQDIQQLQGQIDQEKQMANEQQQQLYKAHYDKMNMLAKKYQDFVATTQKKAAVFAKQQQDALKNVHDAEKKQRDAYASRDNAKRRYDCASKNGGSASSTADVKGAYITAKNKAQDLQDACLTARSKGYSCAACPGGGGSSSVPQGTAAGASH